MHLGRDSVSRTEEPLTAHSDVGICQRWPGLAAATSRDGTGDELYDAPHLLRRMFRVGSRVSISVALFVVGAVSIVFFNRVEHHASYIPTLQLLQRALRSL